MIFLFWEFFSEIYVGLAAGIGGGVSSGVLICIFLGLGIYFYIKRKRNRRAIYRPGQPRPQHFNPDLYEYDESVL
mgnify:FL=1